MDANKRNRYILWGVLAVIVAILYWIIRRNRNSESDFYGFGNTITYNMKNGTDQVKQVVLFSRIFQSPPTGVMVSPNPMELQAEVSADPKIVRKIRLKSTGNTAQVEQPITYVCQRPTGASASGTITPRVTPAQFRDDIVDVHPQNMILDGTCYLVVQLLPNSELNFTITYDEYEVPKQALQTGGQSPKQSTPLPERETSVPAANQPEPRVTYIVTQPKETEQPDDSKSLLLLFVIVMAIALIAGSKKSDGQPAN